MVDWLVFGCLTAIQVGLVHKLTGGWWLCLMVVRMDVVILLLIARVVDEVMSYSGGWLWRWVVD